MVQPYNGILFYHKKEQTTDACYNMDEPQNIKWKKSDVKITYCIIPSTWNVQEKEI